MSLGGLEPPTFPEHMYRHYTELRNFIYARAIGPIFWGCKGNKNIGSVVLIHSAMSQKSDIFNLIIRQHIQEKHNRPWVGSNHQPFG